MYGILDTTKDDHHNKTKPENLELKEVTDDSKDHNIGKFESIMILIHIY